MNMEDVEAQLRYSAMLFHDINWFNEVEELVKSVVKTKRTINSKLISVSVALSDWKSSLPPPPPPKWDASPTQVTPQFLARFP